MGDMAVLGAKVRALRRRENMTQSQLAERLGVSVSYLNLIENNRRPLTAPMLIKLAQLFQLDLQAFAATHDARLVSDLVEVFGDPIFDSHGLTTADLRELATSSPNLSRAVLTLYRSYRAARESAETLADKLSDEGYSGIDPSRLPSEEVSDLIQRHLNYFGDLEDAAEQVWRTARLEEDDIYSGLVRYLDATHGVTVRLLRPGDDRKAMRRYDDKRKLLTLSEMLPPRSRRFQLAHQIGLLTQDAVFERLARDEHLTTAE